MSLNLDRAKLKLHSTKYDFYKILKITRNGCVIPFFNCIILYFAYYIYILYILYTYKSEINKILSVVLLFLFVV